MILLVAVVIALGLVASQLGIEGVAKTVSLAVALVLVWRRQGFWIITREHDAVLFWGMIALMMAILISGLFEIAGSLETTYGLPLLAGAQ